MQKLFIILFSVLTFSQNQKETISKMLDSWHKAAADANFNAYFDLLTPDAIYIGTDATENWTKQAYINYAKPYFDKGKAWTFKAIERNIYFSSDKKMAWFDELLSTQMKICRGSGVLVLQNGKWLIKHYVLSMTIPNDNTREVVKIKTPIEDVILNQNK